MEQKLSDIRIKNILFAISCFIGIEFVSLLSHVLPLDRNFVAMVIFVSIFVILLKHLSLAPYFILGELFIGGKGYLLQFNIFRIAFSGRIILFIIILGIWLAHKIMQGQFRQDVTQTIQKYKLLPYVLLMVYSFFSFLRGTFSYSFDTVFFDYNAWLFLLLVFIFFDLIRTQQRIHRILEIFYASLIWIFIKTVLMFILFSFHILTVGDSIYKWIRDTGVGEITYINDNLYRIFFQSHIYSLMAISIFIVLFLYGYITTFKKSFIITILLYLSSLTLLLSQSRSFWLSGLFIIFIVYASAILIVRQKFFMVTLKMLILFTILYSQISLVQLLSRNYQGNLFTQRLSHSNAEAAGISRVNQLPALLNGISDNYIFGSGFGKTLTYRSEDPRIKKNNPGGYVTTYAFEWGYFDIILKMGIIGLILYFFIFRNHTKNITLVLSRPIIHEWDYLKIGFYVSLLSLFVVNIFTPYLNHPLGIGFIILANIVFLL